MGVVLQSIISCPQCGYQKEEEMPTGACQFFYECKNCSVILKPKKGDCCVFCSYIINSTKTKSIPTIKRGKVEVPLRKAHPH